MEISTPRSRAASDPRRWRSLGRALAAIIVLWPATASAGDPAAEAEALFVEAKRLMAEGDYAAACPKLEQSQRLDPGGGTLIALAHCFENAGRLVRAAAAYREAVEAAIASGNDNRATVARGRLAAVESRLAWIVLEVAPAIAEVPGVEITIDGAPLAPPWGAHAVEAGVRRIEARAPGRAPFVVEREVRVEGARETVRVDALGAPLAPEPREPSAAPPARRALSAPRHQGAAAMSPALRTAGWIAGAAGLGLAGVGAGFGVKALSDDAAADELCPGERCDDPRAVASSRDAVAAGNAATVFVAIGALALATGGVLLWVASGADGARGARVALSIRGAGGAVSASF
jgi:hypothetical protein